MLDKIKNLESLGYKIECWIHGVAVMIKKNSGNLVLPDGEVITLQSPDVQRILNKEFVNMKKYTKKDLAGKTNKELVDIYNQLVPEKPVKKFSTQAAGVERVLKAQPSKTSSANDERVITLTNVEGVKFNSESLRGKCFGLIKDGMSVGDYIKTAAKKDISKTQAMGCLTKMATHPTHPSVKVH